MNDTLVIILEQDEIKFLQKDEKVVDSYNDLCIMHYLQASQLESKHKNYHKTKLLSLKDLLANSNNTNEFIKENVRKYFPSGQV